MTSHPFRAHQTIPAGVPSPLFRRLITEWVDLHQLASTTTTLRTWAALEPVLAGPEQPADLLTAIDDADPQQADALLLALVRLTQAGHPLAGRIVLQAILPKLSTIAVRTRPTGTENTRVEDRRQATVAEAWTVIVKYRVAERTHDVAANLTLDTLSRVTTRARDRDRSVDREIPTDPNQLPTIPDHDLDPQLLGQDLTPDADLAELLAWALRHDVITRADANLLRLVYTPDQTVTGPRSDAAAQALGMTPATVRQRCARARKRLTAAVRAHTTHTETRRA